MADDAERRERMEWVLNRLHDEYPDATISLDFENRLQLLVAVVLSAQCTDERVNEVTPELFDAYRTAADYAAASQDTLADAIYGVTFHNQKAGYLQGIGEQLRDDHDGRVPDEMAALTDLPGVGRKTANVVLQHGHDVVEGVVVDTHVQRLTRRLDLVDAERPEAIEEELMAIVPEAEWQALTHLLISHGRASCTARSPDCADCVLAERCPSDRTTADVDLASGESW
ncbi:endonuclease III [Halococcoides cellulosivorans]|uniref:Endonuclease III n=1 Tax=Halococcoides cellulosivorans TaxID=1679096 RepID=A0A2R4X1V4_9EURY|nr:endonuclease III [Halococcoides cellulosivorans]AWB27779.1 endonuclease III [Halococcoides cellulosivorans]